MHTYTNKVELSRTDRYVLWSARREFDGSQVMIRSYVIPSTVPSDVRRVYIERYMDECTWLKQCDHENIVHVIEIIQETEDSAPELVTEWLGRPLRLVLSETVPPPAETALEWMLQLLKGMSQLHKQNVIHRNICPSTVMLSSTGVPKIVDLCTAVKVGQESPLAMSLENTDVQYAALEVYKSQQSNFATDIYSIGFMTYELLCGHEAFRQEFQWLYADADGDTRRNWMNWHADESAVLRPLHEIAPNVPSYLSTVIDRMTKKNPLERYQDADGVNTDLVHKSREARDNFRVIIDNHLEPTSWSEDDRLSPRLVIDDSVLVRPKPSPTPRAKGTKWIVVVAVLLILLGSWGVWEFLRSKEIEKNVHAYYEQALTSYEKDQFDVTVDTCVRGVKYVKAARKEGRYAVTLAALQVLEEDAKWIGGLIDDLAKAGNELQGGNLEAAETLAKNVADQTYATGRRNADIDALTGKKFARIQESGNSLGQNITVARQIVAALKSGKHRQAYYLFLRNPVLKVFADKKEKARAIVAKLDEARGCLDLKQMLQAEKLFRDAESLSEKTSAEAGYYLAFMTLWSPATLSTQGIVSSCLPSVELDSLQSRILKLLLNMTEAFVLQGDLKQQTAALGARRQALKSDLGAITEEVNTRVAQETQTKGAFFEAEPAPEMRYPVEDSRAFLVNLVVDLTRIRFRMDLDDGNIEAAKADLEAMQGGLAETDRRYCHARLKERATLGGDPNEALTLYQEILSTCPEWSECCFRSAIVSFFEVKDSERALEYLRRAQSIAPSNERYRWWAARIAEQRASLLLETGEKEKARQYCETALEFWPDFPCAWYTMAMSYYPKEMERVNEYLDKFERAYSARTYAYGDEENNMEGMLKIRKKTTSQ